MSVNANVFVCLKSGEELGYLPSSQYTFVHLKYPVHTFDFFKGIKKQNSILYFKYVF